MTSSSAASPTAARGGRAIGAMFFSAFGGAWLALWGYSEFTPALLVLCLVAVLTLGLLAVSYRVYRRNAAALRADGETPEGRRKSRLFNIINASQWVAIFLLGNLLASLDLRQFVLPLIILIVGIHFLPLARLFGYRPHYVTGLALIMLALAYPLLSIEGAQSGNGAFGAGIILWASALWAILPHPDPASARPRDA